MKLNRHTKLKLKVMQALKEDEQRQLQKDLLGALIEDAIPEQEDEEAPRLSRDAEQVPELAQGAAAQLPEPAAKVSEEKEEPQEDESNENADAQVSEEKLAEETSEGETSQAV